MGEGAGGDGEVLDRLLRERRSVRGFRPDPVPPETLRRVFAMAQQAPSNCNAQPWIVHVVSRAAADRLRSALYAAASEGEITPDFPHTGGYPGIYRERQIGSAKALFAATGVGRDDREGRRRSMLRNYRLFDAPHAALVLLPSWAGYREAVDCGMYAQSLMLALTAHGLASCAQASLSFYADVVRRELGIASDLRVLFGISFGYEDTDHPANTARTDRAPVETAITFHE